MVNQLLNFDPVMVHIGQKISERLQNLGVSKTELARKIDTSRENIYGILSRESIDTMLLSKISAALEFNFFQYYNPGFSPFQAEETTVGYKSKGKTDLGHSLTSDAMALQSRVEHLEKMVALQDTLLREKEEKEQLLKAENERLRKALEKS